MNEYNNGQQGYDPNMYGQTGPQFNEQPNMATQFGGNQNYGGPQYNPNMGYQGESKGLSIAALVCGIGSLISWCINAWLVLILGIAAIVLGVIGRKKGGRKMGTAGMVCGIISLVIYVLLILLGFALGIAVAGGMLGSL